MLRVTVNPVNPNAPKNLANLGGKPTGMSRSIAHIAQGLFGSTVANSELPQVEGDGIPVPEALQGVVGSKEYNPALVQAVPGLIGAVQSLMNGGQTPDNIFGRSLDRLQQADDRTRKYTGVRSPENAGELALEVLGSGILGIPKLGQKAGEAAAKAVGGGKLGKAANAAAQVATEVALPIRQTNPRTFAAVAVPMSVAISEATAGEGTTYKPAIVVPDKDVTRDTLPVGAAATSLPDIDWETATPEQAEAFYAQREEELARESQNSNSLFNFAAATALVAAGGYGTYRGLRSAFVSGKRTSPNLVGIKNEASELDTGDQLLTRVFDQNLPMKRAMEKVDPAAAKEVETWLDLSHNSSYAARTQDYILTGRAPMLSGLREAFTGVRYTKVAPMLDSFAKELSPQQQKAVGDALVAASELDDRAATGMRRAFKDFDDKQLQNIVQIAQQDPVLGKYIHTTKQIYRDLLDMQVRAGLLSKQEQMDWLLKRPNYAPLQRRTVHEVLSPDATKYSANNPEWYARDADEGVKGGEAANPILNLPDHIAATIQLAGRNAIRRRVLFDLAKASKGNQPIVRRVKNGVKKENVHTVYDRGEAFHFEVVEPELERALHFYPRATLDGFEQARQVWQNMTTGPWATLFTGFGAFRSTIYDTTTGSLLRPKDMGLGLVNEMLDKMTKGKANIGAADLTSFVGAYTGMARQMVDNINQRLMTNFESALYRNQNQLGLSGQTIKAIADTAARMYESSTLAMLRREGAFSSQLYGTPDPTKAVVGMESISPTFTSAQARDIFDAAGSGNFGLMQQAIAQAQSLYTQASQNKFAQAYRMLLESAHNGFRYSAAAANKNRIPDLEQLAAKVRRISIDPSNYGRGDIPIGSINFDLNKANSLFAYSNISLQSFYEAGRKFASEGPVHMATNFGAFVAPLLGYHMLAMATDPEALERHRAKSLTQRATSVTLSGGVEIPLDPLTRPIVAPTLAAVYHITGMETGTPSLAYAQAFLDMTNEDGSWEPMLGDAWEAAKMGAWSAFPYSPENFTPAIAAAPALGVQAQSLRNGLGEGKAIQTQKTYGFDQEDSEPNDMLSGFYRNAITSWFGAFGEAVYGMGAEVHKSLGQEQGFVKAAQQAGRRYKDTMTAGAGPARPILESLWGERIDPGSASNTDYRIYNENFKAIDGLIQFGRREIDAPGMTHKDPEVAMLIPDDRVIKPEAQGTAAATVYEMTLDMVKNDEYRRLTSELRALTRVAEGIRGQTLTTPNERNLSMSEINRQRREVVARLVVMQRTYERDIGAMIGNRHFRFADYDPKADAIRVDNRPSPGSAP